MEFSAFSPELRLIFPQVKNLVQVFKFEYAAIMKEEIPKLVLEQGEWTWLKPHHQRNALFLVDSSLNLLQVGKAVAEDAADQVQNWIKEGLVARPAPDQIDKWEAKPQTLFSFLIVQPYVLAQLIQLH